MIIGVGPSGNTYKGHMDKAKWGRFKGGRQGAFGGWAWWCENGDNCTQAAIKKKKKKKNTSLWYYYLSSLYLTTKAHFKENTSFLRKTKSRTL